MTVRICFQHHVTSCAWLHQIIHPFFLSADLQRARLWTLKLDFDCSCCAMDIRFLSCSSIRLPYTFLHQLGSPCRSPEVSEYIQPASCIQHLGRHHRRVHIYFPCPFGSYHQSRLSSQLPRSKYWQLHRYGCSICHSSVSLLSPVSFYLERCKCYFCSQLQVQQWRTNLLYSALVAGILRLVVFVEILGGGRMYPQCWRQ